MKTPRSEAAGTVGASHAFWDQAYHRYVKFWIHLARSRSLSEAEARDVVHSIVASLIADPARRFESMEHARNYVARAIINRSIQSKTRMDRIETGALGIDSIAEVIKESEEPGDSSSVLIRKEMSAALRAALRNLPHASFQILKLRFYSGLSFQEISDLLGLPISTLKSREDAALKRIRKSLRKSGVSDSSIG